KCWGQNTSGQLGDGTIILKTTPVLVSGLSNAVAITAGEYFSCALISDGTAKCWGINIYGQLGDGTTTTSYLPVSVSGLAGAVALTVGQYHTCALLSDGTAKCWGRNNNGQLGNGNTGDSPAPVSVSGLAGAVALTAGQYHTCALLSDGTAKCWGYNANGRLGDGTTSNRTTPVFVSGLAGAVAISAGGSHTCALFSDGTAKCWGYNSDGQIGDGSTSTRYTPVAVSNLTGAVAIIAGYAHTCALISDGSSMCWGWNSYGQIGDASTSTKYTPVLVSGLAGAVAITTGNYHTCALLSDGTAKCWGDNANGRLGDGTTTDSSVPIDVSSYDIGGRFTKAGGLFTIPIPAPTLSDAYFVREYAAIEPTVGDAGEETSDFNAASVSFYTDNNYTTPASSYNLIDGLATIYAKDNAAETIFLAVSNTNDNSVNISGDIVVNPAPISYYTITTTSPYASGLGWMETVTAINVLGGVATDNSSTVITPSSTSATARFYTDNTYTTETTTYTLLNGLVTIYAKDTVSGSVILSVSDENSKVGQSGSIVVDASIPNGVANAPEYSPTLTFEVPYTASDEGGSGVRDVELFYTTQTSAPYTWTKFGETFTSSPVTFTAASEGAHGFRLIAYDNVGSSDEASPPVDSTAPESSTIVDITAPTGNITAPLNNIFAPGLPPQFTVAATDEISGVGSVEFQYKLSSASEYTTVSTATEEPYAANWGEIVLANGSSYDLRAVITDRAGNTYTPDAITVVCDAVAPTGSITAPLNNSYSDSVPPAFSASASDDASGVASVKFQYKLSTAADYTDLNTATSAPYAADWGAVTFTDSSIYNLKIIITDAAGNTYSPDAVTVTCDTVEPTGSISAPLDNGRVNSVTPVFTVSAEDSASGVASVKFQYKLSTSADYIDLNTATEAPYSAAWGAVTLSDNSIYNLIAIITDRAGKSFTVTPITITCDITANPAPSAVHIKAGADNNIDYISNLSKAAVSVDVSFAAAPEAGTVYVELSDGATTVSGTADANTAGTVATVSGIDTLTLADGAITVKAKHTDVAGNETSLVSGTAGMKDTIAANFIISYYTNAACTAAFSGDYLKAGTYYMKIAANKSLSVVPTVTIASEGTVNDVTSGAVTQLSGNDYVYTRTIVPDVLAIGAVAEKVYISATDSAGNVVTDLEVSGGKYTDTTAPAVGISIANDYYTSSDWVAASTINGSWTDVAGLLA
ncbi:MAG: Ig-like domain repeat protein, partial [Candidatus Paceibacterota bacterium]